MSYFHQDHHYLCLPILLFSSLITPWVFQVPLIKRFLYLSFQASLSFRCNRSVVESRVWSCGVGFILPLKCPSRWGTFRGTPPSILVFLRDSCLSMPACAARRNTMAGDGGECLTLQSPGKSARRHYFQVWARQDSLLGVPGRWGESAFTTNRSSRAISMSIIWSKELQE